VPVGTRILRGISYPLQFVCFVDVFVYFLFVLSWVVQYWLSNTGNAVDGLHAKTRLGSDML